MAEETTRSGRRQEFQVVLEGVELAPEQVERIDAAIRRAVLQELAEVDQRGSYAVLYPPGRLPGIILPRLDEPLIRQLGGGAR